MTMTTRVLSVSVPVPDQDAALAFYTTVLGCELRTDVEVWPGAPFPLGATWDGEGTNFSIFSEHAEKVELCLFDDEGNEQRVELPEMDGFVWHVFLPGIQPGQRYGYRVHGPFDPSHGLRFNPSKLLLDPYARAVDGALDFKSSLIYDSSDGDSAGHVPVSVVVADSEPPPPISKPVPPALCHERSRT